MLPATLAAVCMVTLQQPGMNRLQELKNLNQADLQQIITQKDEDGR